MAALWTWITANWLQIVVALLAVDRVLIQLFPNATILQTIAGLLTGVSTKPPAA